jgi:CBS domain-containing protein
MASRQILSGIRTQLVMYAPFAQMAERDLDRLVASLTLEYHAPGSVILKPEAGKATACYIVKQGLVRAERIDMPGDGGTTELAPGDLFPVGALLAERAVVSVYRAIGDTFVYRLHKSEFEALTLQSAPFFAFCKRRLSALLDLSQAQVHAAYAQQAALASSLATPLHNLIRRAPVTCQATDTLMQALSVMQHQHVGSLLVLDDDIAQSGVAVAGILTRSDVISRVLLPGKSLTDEVLTVMTTPVMTLDARSTAAEAALVMAQTGVRHIPVVHDGRLKGMVSERDLFAMQRMSLRELGDGIRRATSSDAIVRIASDIRSLSHNLVAQGVGAAQITTLISSLNDRLTARLVHLVAVKHQIDPAIICWVALGSEGRGEQTISTDQDNALIIGDADDLDTGRLVEFAQEINAELERSGFPKCEGGIMAGNPQWCLHFSEWKEKFGNWIESGDPDSLLNASIFFDLRPIAGDHGLCSRLQEFILPAAAGNVRFQKQLADSALRNRVPISVAGWGPEWLADIFGSRQKHATLDLKLRGAMPIVDAARVFALGSGVSLTGTRNRLLRCVELGRLRDDEVAAWIDAFDFIQLMRLRLQHGESRQPASLTDATRLSALDKRILNEALRQARKIQHRLELDYPG